MTFTPTYTVRAAFPAEFKPLGELMVQVYTQLPGFPKPEEQPAYYRMLANIGEFALKPGAELLVAVSPEGRLAGGVVYFSDMQHYGSGGTATSVQNASGFRLLAVDPQLRGQGLAKLLIEACVSRAKDRQHSQVLIHTTKAMQVAWQLYERLGFERAEDLDFMQGQLPVFGFRLML